MIRKSQLVKENERLRRKVYILDHTEQRDLLQRGKIHTSNNGLPPMLKEEEWRKKRR